MYANRLIDKAEAVALNALPDTHHKDSVALKKKSNDIFLDSNLP
jgi:hypothetical protein